MGNNLSNLDNEYLNNESLKLYDKIKETVKNIIDDNNFWTNTELCDKIVITYYDKLIQYDNDELMNTSMLIGIKHDQDKYLNKEELCKNIINHYNKRIQLLTYIMNSITIMFAKLTRVVQGPVCQNVDKYVDNFNECIKLQGIWLDKENYYKIIKKIESLDVYNGWVKHIKNLNNYWLISMKRLDDIIDIIKTDIDNTINDETMDDLNLMVKEVVVKMNYICDIHYLLAINYTD